MTKEEILAEAKRRYPSGTKVKSLLRSSEFDGTVNWEKFNIEGSTNDIGRYVFVPLGPDNKLSLFVPSQENSHTRVFIYDGALDKWAKTITYVPTVSDEWEQLKIKLGI